MVAIDGNIFTSTTSCFRLGALKSGMFSEVESEVKMTRCRLQGEDGEVKSRERLPDWRMLEGRERLLGLLGWRRLYSTFNREISVLANKERGRERFITQCLC